MKKALFLIPLVAAIAACSSTPKVDNQGPVIVSQNIVIDQAPKWMVQVPKESNAVYGAATARSRDYEMSVEKAKTLAQGKVAETYAGVVSKQTKSYREDAGARYNEKTTSVTRMVANDVDFAGVEVVDYKVIRESDGYFRAYILVKLTYSEANPIQQYRIEQAPIKGNSDSEFEDMDRQKPSTKPLANSVEVITGPAIKTASLEATTVGNSSVVARAQDTVNKPDAVVLRATVN